MKPIIASTDCNALTNVPVIETRCLLRQHKLVAGTSLVPDSLQLGHHCGQAILRLGHRSLDISNDAP